MPRLTRSPASLVLALVAGAWLGGCADRPAPTAAPPSSGRAAMFAAGPAQISGTFTGTQTRTPIAGSPGYFRADQVATGTINGALPATVVWAVPMVGLDPIRREVSILTPQWTITMTLGTGEQIFARYTFPASTLHYSPLGGYTAIARVEMTGGTGGYAAATGHGTAVIKGNVFTGGFSVRLEGVVAIPAS